MDVDDLLTELIANIHTARRLGPRMRLAVTALEFERLRQHSFDRNGFFNNRVRALPLVIEDDPKNPPMMVEFQSISDSSA